MTNGNQDTRRSRLAIVSLILGILSVGNSVRLFSSSVFVSEFLGRALPIVLFAIVAIALGHRSSRRIKTSEGILKGRRVSLVGLSLGYLSLAFLAWGLLLLVIHSYLNPPNYEIAVRLRETPAINVTPALVQKAEDIISAQLTHYGVPHKIYLKDSGTIAVQIRVTESLRQEDVAGLLGTRMLSFHLVHEDSDSVARQMHSEGSAAPPGFVLGVVQGEELLFESQPLLADHIDAVELDAEPSRSTPMVRVQFDPEGTRRLAEITREHMGRRLAILLDDKVLSAPRIAQAITDGRANIGGLSTEYEARAVVLALNMGRIPVPMDIVDQHYIRQ